jgi:hypothetical protein
MVVGQQQFSINQVRQVLGGVLGQDLHAKRVASLCDATLGVLRGASLAVCTIGHGLAAARGLNSKHATKQVDRLLSNPNINVDDILARWVPYIVGARSCIVVALDWTDFDADKQATIMLSLITEPAPPPPGCDPADALGCCAPPRSPPTAMRWEPWSAFRIPT